MKFQSITYQIANSIFIVLLTSAIYYITAEYMLGKFYIHSLVYILLVSTFISVLYYLLYTNYSHYLLVNVDDVKSSAIASQLAEHRNKLFKSSNYHYIRFSNKMSEDDLFTEVKNISSLVSNSQYLEMGVTLDSSDYSFASNTKEDSITFVVFPNIVSDQKALVTFIESFKGIVIFCDYSLSTEINKKFNNMNKVHFSFVKQLLS